MAILDPDPTNLGAVRSNPASWREYVTRILQNIQTVLGVGAGSGVDADLLDGEHGAFYTKIRPGWNGSCTPNPVIVVASNGSQWTLTLTGTGTTDLECLFDGIFYVFDTTPAISINLTAGTDTVPQANYIYLTESGGTVSINVNTTGFPVDAAIVYIAECLLQSAATGETLDAYMTHQHSEHIAGPHEGMIIHHSEKLRELGATWFSGIAPADLVVSAPDAYISMGAGVAHQLHSHVVPAIDDLGGRR